MADLGGVRDLIRHAQRRHRAVQEAVRSLRVPYYRRGEMSIPAFKMRPGGDPEKDGREQSLKLMRKAAELPVDFFFFDLEDAAPDHPDYKPLSRRFLIEAFQTLDFGDRVRAFRPNNIRTDYFEDDLVEVVTAIGDRLDAIVLPKSETADEVADVQETLRAVQEAAGHKNRIAIEVLIESPRGFVQAERIAALEDVSALIFGAWDFARTIGGTVEAETWLEDQGTARQMLPIVAAAYGKEAVDAVTATLPIRPKDPDDDEGREKHARALALAGRDADNARRIGYAAKWILHPDQIEPIQGAWTPKRERALSSLHLAARYWKASHSGSGAEVHGEQLADKAVVGTEWWIVRAALKAGVLSPADVTGTGVTLEQLERSVKTRD